MDQEKILVVEDEDYLCQLLTDLLNFEGYRYVQTAPNGQEGVQKYMKERPALVLMDLDMPVMNGYESSREIKRYDPHANIVVITANPQSLFARRILQEGYASLIVRKPFDLTELLEAISKSLTPPLQSTLPQQ